MKLDFDDLMSRAAALTRSGDLSAATAAIQRALGGLAPAASPTGMPAGTPAGAPTATPDPRPFDTDAGLGDVIDIDARVVPDAVPAGGSDAPAASAPQAEAAPRRAADPGESFVAGRHTEGARHLDYKLYTPPGAGARPMPLVVMLHGCTQNPDDFAAGTAMNDAARAQGFCVLYPAQSQQANPQRCWNWFKHNHQQRGRGEPALIAGMARAVMARHRIDPQRVYVAGLSAGGAMAAVVGEAYPELFAAVGVHSGLAAGVATDLPSALAAMQGQGKRAGTARAGGASGVPTIVFQGDADATVNAANGTQVIAASVGTAARVEREPRPAGARRAHTRALHRDVDGRVLAEHWVVHGAPHAWSGGQPAGSYTDAKGPDATAEMLRFFFEHPRAAGA